MTHTPTTRHGPLDPGTAAEVRHLAAAAAAADGVPPLSEQPLLHLTARAPTAHVLVRDGALVGYAQLDLGAPTVSAELVVAPDARRRGVGRALLDAARSIAVPDGATGRRLSVWAHGDLPAARALAARAGLDVVRELWLMSVDLPRAGGGPQLPRGVIVREFVPGQDEDQWRHANARAFAGHPEQGRISREDLAARMAEPWFDPAGFLLAERDSVLLGSVWTKVHPADAAGGPVGEIYVVGIDPDAQGLGLGGALTECGLDYLTSRGLHRAILYTDADNAIAIRTYARAGFARTGVDVQFG